MTLLYCYTVNHYKTCINLFQKWHWSIHWKKQWQPSGILSELLPLFLVDCQPNLIIYDLYINVSAAFDQKNLAREESIKNEHNYVVTSHELKVIASVPAIDISTEYNHNI